MRNRTIYSVPPRWANIIGGALSSVMLMLLIYFKIDASYPRTSPVYVLFIVFVYMAFSCVSYDFTEKSLVTKYCGIPIIRTPWTQIVCAVYLPEIKRKRGRKACIVLSKSSGKPYIPVANENFLKRNPFTTIRINVYDYEVEDSIQALEQCVDAVYRLNHSL